VADILLGFPAQYATLNPNNAAWQEIAPRDYLQQTKQVILQNSLSGPGITPAAIDIDFKSDINPKYTAHIFHALINQPAVAPNNMRQQDIYYFNETFAQPKPQTGTVVLYSPPLPTGLEGHFEGVGGYSVNGENVGYNPESCAIVYQNLDPKVLP
jgi:hypothetical protein